MPRLEREAQRDRIGLRTRSFFKRYLLHPFCPCVLHNYQPLERNGTICKGVPHRLFTEGTLENKLLKAVIGVVCGFLFGLILFIFLVQMMRVSFGKASFTCSIVGCVTAFGLAFSKNFRCVAFLTLPELFSTRGRSVLLATAYFLVLSGPFLNMTNNLDILSKSVSCQMESIKNQTKEDLKAAFSPVLEHMESIKKVLEAVVEFGRIVREAFMAFSDLIKEILEGIKKVYKWFARMLNICPRLMKTPQEYCYSMLREKEMKCYKVMFFLAFLCLLVRGFAEIVCPLLGVAAEGCNKLKEFKEEVLKPIEKRIDEYCQKMHDEFYVNITTYTFYDYKVYESQTATEIKKAIMLEIEERTYGILLVFKYVSFLSLLGLAWLLFRSLLYRWKYLRVNRYDNIYITRDVRDLNAKRIEDGEESIFPLSFIQKRKYIKPWSLKLTKNERKRALFSFTIFAMGTLQIGTYLFLDYILYNLIDMIAYHGKVNFKVPLPFNVELKVKGTSYLADMYRSIADAFNPILRRVPGLDTRKCVPLPNPPDYDLYEVIGILLLLCLIFSVTEVYGMRLRHVICGCYYPEREKQRAEWIYNHILKTKGTFLTQIRRFVKRKYKDWDAKRDKNIKLIDFLYLKLPCFRSFFRWMGYEKTFCLVCSTKVEEHYSITCPRPRCNAVYCDKCFEKLNNQCTACVSPLEYGDSSDISEVVDSSDDEILSIAIARGKERKRRLLEDNRME